MSTEERFEKTFVVGEAPLVSVSNVKGNITVQSEDRDDIQVTAVKHVNGNSDSENTKVQMYQEGDRVVIKTRYHDEAGWLKWLRGDRVCAVDYAVQVPTHCAVKANQVNGTVYVNGVTGRVKVNVVEGDVELHEITGHTRVHAVSAAVDGDGWCGQAQVNTVSGPVQITDAQLSQFKANTVSGDLSVETTVDDAGRYDFHSVSGDVTFYLPMGHGLESRGTTLSGQLYCELPHQFTRRGRGGWQATINGGGPRVRFHSISGDLEVLEGGGA